MTTTYQVGSVWKAGRATLDVDTYNIQFENDYWSTPDPLTGEPVYFLNGTSVTKGVEVESTILVARGLTTEHVVSRSHLPQLAMAKYQCLYGS